MFQNHPIRNVAIGNLEFLTLNLPRLYCHPGLYMVPGWNSGPLKYLLFVAVMTKTTYRRKSLFHLRLLEGCSLMVEKDGSGCLETFPHPGIPQAGSSENRLEAGCGWESLSPSDMFPSAGLHLLTFHNPPKSTPN